MAITSYSKWKQFKSHALLDHCSHQNGLIAMFYLFIGLGAVKIAFGKYFHGPLVLDFPISISKFQMEYQKYEVVITKWRIQPPHGFAVLQISK